MGEIKITATSDFVASFLGCNRVGKVHSEYEHTVNLNFGEQMISIQASPSQLSPVSVVISMTGQALASMDIEQGDECQIKSEKLSILGRNHISFMTDEHTIYYNPSVYSIKKDVLEAGLASSVEVSLEAFRRADHDGMLALILGMDEAVNGDLVMMRAAGLIDEARGLAADYKWKEMAAALAGLIGLGGGLTPAGDDFLMGVLAGAAAAFPDGHPLIEELNANIEASLDRTNDISAMFLKCALDGMFSETVIKLLSGDSNGKDSLATSFISIGHSSGRDSLAGILFVSNMIK